jgi:hypothetical protein
MNTLIFNCVAPVLLFLMSWGVGSLMSTIGKIRGWNTKTAFWLSAIAYALIVTMLYTTGDAIIGLLGDAFGAVVVIVFVALFTVGVLCPFVNLALKRAYPHIFVKPSTPGTKPIPDETLGKNKQPSSEPIKPPADIKGKENKAQDVVPSQIFVSYRRSDSADVTGRIYDRLIGRFDKNLIFKDVDSIPLGLDFKEYLDKKVGECDVLLAIIGDRWLDASDGSGARRLNDPSDFVRIEIESALERGIPVIPLLVRGATMPREESLPISLRKLVYRNGIPIRSDPDFHRDMDRLIKALEKYVQHQGDSYL